MSISIISINIGLNSIIFDKCNPFPLVNLRHREILVLQINKKVSSLFYAIFYKVRIRTEEISTMM